MIIKDELIEPYEIHVDKPAGYVLCEVDKNGKVITELIDKYATVAEALRACAQIKTDRAKDKLTIKEYIKALREIQNLADEVQQLQPKAIWQ
jgi:ribosomal protein S6